LMVEISITQSTWQKQGLNILQLAVDRPFNTDRMLP